MAISFNSDSLSTELKKVNPSIIGGKSPKIKTLEINNTINNSAPQIKSKVLNSVENFKNIKTGAIPEIEISSLDKTVFTDQIKGELDTTLTSLGDVQNKLNVEKLKKEINFDTQLDSIDTSKISTAELSKFQGNMFEDVKAGVSDISNTQLRDFSLDPSKQLKEVDSITNDVLDKAKVAAEQGISDADKAKVQSKTIDTLNDLVDKKNIFV